VEVLFVFNLDVILAINPSIYAAFCIFWMG